MTEDAAEISKVRRPIAALLLVLFLWLEIAEIHAVQFSVSEGVGGQGEMSLVEVRVDDFSSVQAFQFSLQWNPDILELGELIDFGVPGLGGNSFGLFQEQGRLSVIWDSATFDGENLGNGAVLFRLSFSVLGDDGALSEIVFEDNPTVRLVVQDLARGLFESVSGSITVGKPPEIEAVTTFSMSEDQISESISVTLTDDVTPSEDLEVSFTSSDEGILPPSGIRLEGLGATRGLILEPLPNQFGLVEIGIRAVDQNGGISIHFLLVTVISINDPPRAEDDDLTLDEDSDSIEIDVLANDSFAPDPGERLSIESVSMGSMGGQAEIRESIVIYQPRPNFFGVETFDYVIGDGAGATATAKVTLTVNSVNDPPTAVNDQLVVIEDSEETSVPVLENDSVAPDEGEVLQVIGVSIADQGGEVELRDGRVFYRPAPDFFGVETFQYSIEDGNGGVAETSVQVDVTPVNDVPVAVADGVSVPEDSVDVFIAVLANDHDGPDEGEVLFVDSATRGSSGGLVRVEKNGIFYSTSPNFFGNESFEYTIGDGNGGKGSAEVRITVINDRADSPVARDDRFLVEEDSGANLLLIFEDNGNGRDFDPDGDTIALIDVVFVGESGGSVEIHSEGIGIVYTPGANFVGSETLSYTISDGERTSNGFVFVNVSDSNNDPPLAFEDSFVVDEDSQRNRLNVLDDNGFGADQDPEGVALSVSLVPGGEPSNGVLSVSEDGMALVYSPFQNFSGVDQFPYFVSDGSSQSRALVSVTVVNVDDDPPVARDDRFELLEDVSDQLLDVLADHGNGSDFDPEGGELFIESIEISAELLIGTISIGDGGGNLFYTPRQNFVGQDVFSYVVTDGTHRSVARVLLDVLNADDDPPVALDDHFVVDEDSGTSILPVLGTSEVGFDFDPEGEVLKVVAVSTSGSRGGSLSIGPLGRTVRYTPASNFSGLESFDYEISDGSFSATGEVIVMVENIDNDPPVATEDHFVVAEDSVDLILRVLEDNGAGVDFDPEGTLLRIVGVDSVGSAIGDIFIAEGERAVLYSPAKNFVGTESFRYTVSDGESESDAIFSITVTNDDNDPPVARDDQFFALEDGGVIELRVLEDNGNGPDFDPEGDVLSIASIPSETDGSTSISLNEDRTVILYASSSDFFGVDRFSYSIGDGVNLSEAMVTVVITRGDNDAPVSRDDAFTVAEDSVGNRFDVLSDNGNGADSDPDEDPIRIVAVHGPASEGGSVRLISGGSRIGYDPPLDFHGVETFTYTISDGQLTSTGKVNVSVTPVPDPPVVGLLLDVVVDQRDGSYVFDLMVDDVDSIQDSLTLKVISENDVLLPSERIEFERVENGWRITLAPMPGEAGVTTVNAEVSDGGLISQSSFRFTVAETVAIVGTTSGGFLRGGVVFVDLDGDGRPGEEEAQGEIQPDGGFEFYVRLADVDADRDGRLSYADGFLTVNEAVDLWTGLSSSIQMRAPLGEPIVSPLSTLVSSVLEAGGAQSLEGAAERAIRMIGQDLDGMGGLDLLRLNLRDPLVGAGEQALGLLVRMTQLYALAAQVTHLVAGNESESRFGISKEVFLFLAERDSRIFSDCSVVGDLIRSISARFDLALNSHILEFSQRTICQYLDRIERLNSGVLLPDEVEGSLTRLHSFSEFEIVTAFRSLGRLDDVPDDLLFKFLPAQIDMELMDYPFLELLGNQQAPGRLRFLHKNVSVVEEGRDSAHVVLVREGGSFGSLDAALLIVGGTASVSADFSGRPLVVHFEDGERRREISLAEYLVDDDEVEGEENAEIRLFYGNEVDEDGNALVRDASQMTIIDDDSVGVFEFSQETFSVEEDRPEKAVFVSRRGGLRNEAFLTVALSEPGGDASAESGSDFDLDPISAVFREGEMIKGVLLPIVGDFRVEEDELVVLELSASDSGASRARVGERRSALLSIVNDDFDRIPTIESISDQVILEDQVLTVSFSVGDDSTPLNELTVDAFSKNLGLVVVEQLEWDPLVSRFSLVLQSVPDAHGEGLIEIQVSDPFQTVSQSFSVIVTPVNDAPELFIRQENRVLYIEDEAPIPVAVTLTIIDVDADGLIGATLEFTNGFRAGEDRLIFGGGENGIAANYDRERGVMTLSGAASIESYQGAIRRVLYDNRSGNPNPLSRNLSIRVRDELLESNAVESVILVEPVNDPPLLARLESDPLVYVEGGPPNPVSTSILVATLDDPVFTEAIVRISGNFRPGEDRLLVGELPVGLAVGEFNSVKGELIIMGEGNLTDYQTAIRSVSYQNLSDRPGLSTREVEFLIRDEGKYSKPQSREIRIVAVNDPPVFELPPDIELVSGKKGGFRFKVVDPDSDLELPVVSIGSSNPSLIPSSSVRLTRDGDAIVLQFETREGQIGQAEFKLSVTDGIDSVSESFLVTVLPLTFAPTITGPTKLTINEDGRINLPLQLADADNVFGDLVMEFTIDNRTLFPEGSVVLARKLSEIEISLTPAENLFGETILSVFVSDAEHTVEHRVVISVVSENDLPSVSGLKDFRADPGSDLEIDLFFDDVETPVDQLLFGLRPLDPRLAEQLFFEFESRANSRTLRLHFDETLKETVSFELVVVDGDGGASTYPFSVTVRDRKLGSSTLRIVDLGAGNIELLWEGAGRLAISSEIDGPFLVIPGSSSPFQLRSLQSQEFFKLVE